MTFLAKLNGAMARNQSLWCLGLDPNPEVMPEAYRRPYDRDRHHLHAVEILWDWMQYIIDSTADRVCAYKPTLGFYTALGAPGLDLLAKTLAAIPADIPVILDAKHQDLSSSTVLAQTAFGQWQVDAITLSPYLGQDLAARFLMYLDRGVFISCYSANTTALPLQNYPHPGNPLYLELVQQCQTWGSWEQLALEVGSAQPAALAQVRTLAPERLILARSIWAGTTDLPVVRLGDLLQAGLDAQGGNLLLPVNQDVLATADPQALIGDLRDQTQDLLDRRQQASPHCTPWMPNVCTLTPQPHGDLILQLFDLGCIAFGDYVQASGQVFPYYIDLRRIISNPQTFDAVIDAYGDVVRQLVFDRIAGIPYGALPTASGLALKLNRPLIFPRKEVKAYGARRLVEGNYEPGETAVVVDDILITGKSAVEGAQKLQSCGLLVRDIVVFIDHGGGARERLAAQGYTAWGVLTITEINHTLYETGRITEMQFEALCSQESDQEVGRQSA
ncbi:bifunctional orotidine-5'-phosphate decarboxylase/orotate phosphoribosyltransferase [Prochlorothrix hollandica]|uniref:Orotate phosphoribosyltransferase n=1 Tax=Prochlorothrix hollandica PCC 9006 = CALU 1027 TaxID=317619 RepID=A0A0M2PWU1_PROHO|nr:bifunctional orotidine-5'-phosphate decarboxylase/orotate phosphoribosyltransferase [Prochlorothrix hollandica]KKJ00896.1 bifunctional orotidine 5'-phosphate decarboxylase/orotate phosphoribosyltransferase [Prochlorothrix hollandica PCC 9006 = CALU 1027]